MKLKVLSIILISASLVTTGYAATDQPAYYHSFLLDESTFKLGDTFIRPPVLRKTYTFQVDRIPIAARLKTEIFHQGSTELPKISVNGKPAGFLSPRWADLSSRDYEIFFFDQGEGFSQAFDYNNWTTADCWISPDLLKIGENKLLITTARAETSQADDIKLRNIEVEIRYLDREDKVTDLRQKSRNLPLPYSSGDNQAEIPEKQTHIKSREKSKKEILNQQAKNTKSDKRASGATAVAAKTLKRGDPVPDFNVKRLDGETISLKDLRGKVVLLDFWATWCPPCRPEIPRIREAYQKYHGRGFEVIGISLDKSRKKLEKFIKDKKIIWPQVFDGKGWRTALAKLYGVHSIPRPILLDRETLVYTPNARGKKLDRALAELFKDDRN